MAFVLDIGNVGGDMAGISGRREANEAVYCPETLESDRGPDFGGVYMCSVAVGIEKHRPEWLAGSYLPLGEDYEWGSSQAEKINAGIKGRVMQDSHGLGVIATVLGVSNGNYLEIGSYFGGTAILAGLFRMVTGKKYSIHCIDPYDGDYPWLEDVVTRQVASAENWEKNLNAFGIEATLYQVKSQEMDLVKFGRDNNIQVVLIDGDHSPAQSKRDIYKVAEMGPEYIIIDDVALRYDHLYETVLDVATNGKYKLVHLSGVTAVLQANWSWYLT